MQTDVDVVTCTWVFIICISIHLTAAFRRKELKARVTPTRKPFVADKFIEDIWNYHNQIRFLHGVPPLEIDSHLSQNSDEWADVLIGTGSGTNSDLNETARLRFVKWANDEYNENLYYDPQDYNEVVPENPAYEAFFHSYEESSTKIQNNEKGWYTKFEKKPTPMDYECTPTISVADVQYWANIIWKDTKYVGCGHAFGFSNTNSKNVTVVVCQYMPMHKYSVEDLCKNIKEPSKGRSVKEFKAKNLTLLELHDATRAKHPLVRFQKQLLDFVRTMKMDQKRPWYDFF